MCLTCGCSDGLGVRITDPATGETTTLEGAALSGMHEHTDASGRRYSHVHSLTEGPAASLPADQAGERHDA